VWRIFNYNYLGTEIKTNTVFSYDTDDTLKESTTYKDDLTTTKSRSPPTRASRRGEAQKTYNYNFLGEDVKTVTMFSYVDDTLTQSTTYKKDEQTKKSITTYAGFEARRRPKRPTTTTSWRGREDRHDV